MFVSQTKHPGCRRRIPHSAPCMDAMILAAGLGTRLRPLTDSIPKALVPVAGVPMLERVARRLIEAGATRLIINVHHHADLVARFVAERAGFGVETVLSDESGELLDTGGGLLHAASLFSRTAPFFLHNVDVETNIDLRRMYAAHRPGQVATLAVLPRNSARYLLFDSNDRLAGYGNDNTGFETLVHPDVSDTRRFGFCGIHVISPEIFPLIDERGVFSIIPLYLRLAASGHHISLFDCSGSTWIDIGKPDQLERARLMQQ